MLSRRWPSVSGPRSSTPESFGPRWARHVVIESTSAASLPSGVQLTTPAMPHTVAQDSSMTTAVASAGGYGSVPVAAPGGAPAALAEVRGAALGERSGAAATAGSAIA